MSDRTMVRVRRAIGRAVIAHARDVAPRECCGLLLGAGQDVLFSTPLPNRAVGTRRYRIDPRAHIELQRMVRRFVPQLSIVGAYHSHPGGAARPSPADVAEAYYPDWIHVIVSLAGARPRVAAFRIAGGRPEPMEVRWV